jgi:hypothetical protein
MGSDLRKRPKLSRVHVMGMMMVCMVRNGEDFTKTQPFFWGRQYFGGGLDYRIRAAGEGIP